MTVKFSSKRPLTDEEETKVQRMIASDPDNPELTDAELASMKPFREVLPELAKAIDREKARRGRPRVENPKQAVTLRVHPDTLAKFKAAGRNWRTKMADALDKADP